VPVQYERDHYCLLLAGTSVCERFFFLHCILHFSLHMADGVFFLKKLTLHSHYSLFYQFMHSMGIKPTLVLLAPLVVSNIYIIHLYKTIKIIIDVYRVIKI